MILWKLITYKFNCFAVYNQLKYSNFGRMSKIEKIKEKYAEDAELMASKSRFGYFSLLPSHTAARTDTSGQQSNHSFK